MTFDDDVVQAICTYMNNDPMESNLTIVQGITGDRDRGQGGPRLLRR